MNIDLPRCNWCESDPLYRAYHDDQWGVPEHDDRRLFEMLILEGAQAGLSWLTILRKRDNYRRAFGDFDIVAVSRFGPQEIELLLGDAGIVRNRRKIEAAVKNARAVLKIQEEFGSLDTFLWQFVDHRPVQNRRRTTGEVPSRTEASDRMSLALKKRGCSFVGSTICYALMQAIGMVNDHTVTCFRHEQIRLLAG
ncbi:MAG: DNA-3-methyladenine glycosylase I [Desulfofustis sp.]|nr:DNA-3-methyladenine glycosylase I [Desulfofustis sp.]